MELQLLELVLELSQGMKQQLLELELKQEMELEMKL
jgi:hypothetical protein